MRSSLLELCIEALSNTHSRPCPPSASVSRKRSHIDRDSPYANASWRFSLVLKISLRHLDLSLASSLNCEHTPPSSPTKKTHPHVPSLKKLPASSRQSYSKASIGLNMCYPLPT
ncbi:hypothetical protein GOP47_0017077 [Adiantum capillus-veneris]|uniref:Uncharacterized protein n=1 Tax=Adiantum capillus-veneris TaxID=13818 RepID=A0A9D4UJ90_ADICA|nr:hypothetical protein GOP47_0017077 [Adiantum capillus-veneris]